MDKTYQFKDLIELIPFEPKELSQKPKWDIYGDGMFVCVATVEGVWLCKFGRGFDERSERGLIGLSLQDMAEKRIDGVGIVYGMKDGTPFLPFPFTMFDFSIFNQRVAGMVTRVNQRGEHTGKWLAKLRKRSIDAIDLAMVILYGDLPMSAEIYPPVPGIAPAQTLTTPVTVLAAAAAQADTTPKSVPDSVKPESNGPAQTDDDPCAAFRAMPKLKASDLNISFVGDKSESGLGANNMLEISAHGTKKRIPLGSLGLLDRRNGSLNSQCAILVGMAKGEKLSNTTKNVKKVQRLRAALRDTLGIKDDPFEPFLKFTGWKPRFTLSDKRGAADKRAKDKAEFRQPSIEKMSALGRHIAAPNERRQNYAADEWMHKNGYTFSNDDLDQDN